MKRKHHFDLGGKSSYFLEKVNLVLKPAGFSFKKKENAMLFHRGTLFGYNQVYLSTTVEDRMLRITPYFYVRVNSVNMIANPFLGCPEKLYGCNPTIGANLRNLGLDEDHLLVKTIGDVEASLFIFEDIVESKMLPFFNAFYSAARLDEELNRDERPANLFLNDIIERPVVGTVAAMLNRNKRFSALVDYYRRKLLMTTPKIEENYESLLKFLQTNCQ
ncbi:hypothetical protein [Chryseolinea soli]|uniref:DUF4304 domain-containing protein n=1 Tax=Chryseolinea soli TaxID=2321403 RepID=A0A385SVG9_9BACT|nr:hypothetical protein [Chryseolinea soli]AYB32778.1 hypothetical protein D4L85_20320 [Chryseolinea soli]